MTDPLRKAAERVRQIMDAYAADEMDLWRALGEPVRLRSSHVALELISEALDAAALQPTDAGGEEPTGRLEQPEAPQASPVSTANGGGAAVVTAPTDPLATAINRYAGPGRELFEMMLAEIRKR